MFLPSRLPFAALVLAAPFAFHAPVAVGQDFQLPPNPTPTPSPRAQGPVDTESGNLPVAPRVIATATPTPSPTITPSPTATPTFQARPIPSPLPTVTPRAPARTVPRPQAPSPQLPEPVETIPVDPSTPAAMPSPIVTTPPAAPASEADTSDPTENEDNAWLWPAIGGGALLLLGAGYALGRRRRTAPVPQIERPLVAETAHPAAAPDIKLEADVIKLTRSVMNATLQYRVSVMNRSAAALSDVAFGADIVSAHSGAPVDQQVASTALPLEQRHVFARIAPGQSVRYDGQLTVPLSQVRPIRQGNSALFVPLLRLRIDGAGEQPVVKTFVVGQGAPGAGRVMPFRLDEGPRSYEPIAARALD